MAPPAITIPQQQESETEVAKAGDGYLKSKAPKKSNHTGE